MCASFDDIIAVSKYGFIIHIYINRKAKQCAADRLKTKLLPAGGVCSPTHGVNPSSWIDNED